MLRKILVVLVAVVVLFVIVVAARPSQFLVTRTANINAPDSAVFAQINDLHRWPSWSPWAKLDPNMKQSYDGAPAGTGASSSWAGNSKAGEGRMTIIESKPNEVVRMQLEFLKPFKATDTAEFILKPENNHTLVVWNMRGTNNFMFKAVGMFMNMDKMIGGDFERGLAQLKSIVETPPKATPN